MYAMRNQNPAANHSVNTERLEYNDTKISQILIYKNKPLVTTREINHILVQDMVPPDQMP